MNNGKVQRLTRSYFNESDRRLLNRLDRKRNALSGKRRSGGKQKRVRARLRRKLPATKQKNVHFAKSQPRRHPVAE
jgi:hypothetical protein